MLCCIVLMESIVRLLFLLRMVVIIFGSGCVFGLVCCSCSSRWMLVMLIGFVLFEG